MDVVGAWDYYNRLSDELKAVIAQWWEERGSQCSDDFDVDAEFEYWEKFDLSFDDFEACHIAIGYA